MPDILATSTTTGVSVAKSNIVYNDPNYWYNTSETANDPKAYIKRLPSSVSITAPAAANGYLSGYYSLEDISNIDFTGCTSMHDTFYHCRALKEIDLSLPVCTAISCFAEDMPSLKSINLRDLHVANTMTGFFNNATNSIETLTFSDMPAMTTFIISSPALQSLTVGDLASATSFKILGCLALTNLTVGDIPNLTSLRLAFMNCYALTEIPYLDTSKVTDMYYAFEYCRAIKTIPLLDTSKVTNMREVFYVCTELEVVPALDVSSVTDFTSAFQSDSKLKEIHWTGAKYSWNCSASTQFTESALIEILNNLGNAYNNAQTLTMGSTNKAKLTSAEGVAALAAAQAKGWTVN